MSTDLSTLKPSAVRSLTVQTLQAASDRTLPRFAQAHGWGKLSLTFRARRDERAEEHQIIPESVRRSDLNGFYKAVTSKGAVIMFHCDSIDMEVSP